jgi:hypothetical protein
MSEKNQDGILHFWLPILGLLQLLLTFKKINGKFILQTHWSQNYLKMRQCLETLVYICYISLSFIGFNWTSMICQTCEKCWHEQMEIFSDRKRQAGEKLSDKTLARRCINTLRQYKVLFLIYSLRTLPGLKNNLRHPGLHLQVK